jgi:hypothetical protein
MTRAFACSLAVLPEHDGVPLAGDGLSDFTGRSVADMNRGEVMPLGGGPIARCGSGYAGGGTASGGAECPFRSADDGCRGQHAAGVLA